MARSARYLVLLMLAAGSVCIARAQQQAPAPASQPGVVRLQVRGGGQIIIQGGGTLQLNGVVIQAGPQQPGVPNAFEQIDSRDRHFASDVAYPGTLQSLVATLESNNYEERQQAMETLMRLSPDRLPEVRSALERETNAEAVARLTQVAVHLYMKVRTPLEGPMAMMGIMFNAEAIRQDPRGDESQMSIAVMDILPGYPAAQELRVGDRLIAVDGQTIPLGIPTGIDEQGLVSAGDGFKRLVGSHKAGDVVPFKVIRNGKQVEVGVQLAAVVGGGTEQARAERSDAAGKFVAKLKTGIERKPLIIKDDSAGASIFDENLQK